MMSLFQNKRIFLGFVACCILFVILFVFFQNRSNNYNSLKIDQSKYLVYTESQVVSGSYYQYKPFVNLKGDVGSVINQDINNYLSNFSEENISITYDSDLNGKVLSLVLKVEDHSYAESATLLSFRSYHIHMGSKEILSNEVLLSYFGLTSSDVEGILEKGLQNYYQELLRKGEVSNSCGYTCFKDSYNFTEGVEDVSYFVRDSKLYAYKPYISLSSEFDTSVVHEFEIA